MDRSSRNEGLSLWYRFSWRVRYMLVNVFGPARLGDDNDPAAVMRQERQARVDRHAARPPEQGALSRALVRRSTVSGRTVRTVGPAGTCAVRTCDAS